MASRRIRRLALAMGWASLFICSLTFRKAHLDFFHHGTVFQGDGRCRTFEACPWESHSITSSTSCGSKMRHGVSLGTRGGEKDFTCLWESSTVALSGAVWKDDKGYWSILPKDILHSFPLSPHVRPPDLCPCLSARYLMSFKKLGFLCSKRGCSREGMKLWNAEKEWVFPGFSVVKD